MANSQQHMYMPVFNGSSFPIPAAPMGTPLSQIPRIGFDDPVGPRVVILNGQNLNFNGSSTAVDPRSLRSYVDLDAPSAGDLHLNYG